MWQRILRWFSALAIFFIYCLPAHAQSGSGTGPIPRSPAGAYTVAFLATLLVLLIICAPSRKSFRDRGV